MSELQKYIEHAKRMQTATPGTIGWISAANPFRDMSYTQVASLMIQADAELQRLRDENQLLQRAVEWCLQNGARRDEFGVYAAGSMDDAELPPELAPVILGRKT